MRLVWLLFIFIAVSAVLTVIQAKSSSPSKSGKISHSPIKHSKPDHGKNHKDSDHKAGSHSDSKSQHSHEVTHDDKPKPKRSGNKKKHNDGKIELTTKKPGQKLKLNHGHKVTTTTKKPEEKKKQRHEGKKRTTPLPGLVHRKQPGGSNVTNDGTGGVGSIISAPLISCPEGQRRVTYNGASECRTVFR